MFQEPIYSPCIGVCTVADCGLCMGCFRTMEEITAWLSLTESERKLIMTQLPGRRESLFT